MLKINTIQKYTVRLHLTMILTNNIIMIKLCPIQFKCPVSSTASNWWYSVGLTIRKSPGPNSVSSTCVESGSNEEISFQIRTLSDLSTKTIPLMLMLMLRTLSTCICFNTMELKGTIRMY